MIKIFTLLLITSWMWMSEVCAQKKQTSTLESSANYYSFQGIWLTDASTGIALGCDFNVNTSLLMRTEDAGASWNQQTHPVAGGQAFNYLWDLCFSDAMNGWAVGGTARILNTKDGGKTWIDKSRASGAVLSIFCTDSLTFWAGSVTHREGAFGPLFWHTSDGGYTWTKSTTEEKTYPWAIFFINADTGFSVGGWCIGCVWYEDEDHDKGSYIWRTTDGGDTWNLVEKDTNTLGYQDVFFTNDTIGYVVGSGGTIKRTTDCGETWTKQTSGTTVELYGAYFLNTDTGFVVGGNEYGYGGIILYTTDGGSTWTNKVIPTNKALNDIYFIDDSTGTAVGEFGTIISTTNRGETWTEHVWPPVNSIVSNKLLTVQNYPNPFNGSATIRYEVPEPGNVTLKIYSYDGKIIATLVDEEMVMGIYEVTWDAGDLPDGIYFYRIQAGSFSESGKLMLLR